MTYPTLTALTLCASALAQPMLADVQSDVDQRVSLLEDSILAADLKTVVEIDHARLAAEAGVTMPPSRVVIFTDLDANGPLLRANVRTGLDLPMRVLNYDDGETAAVMYTDLEFLAKRHGLDDIGSFSGFSETLNTVLETSDLSDATPAPTEGLDLDYGILQLTSIHDFPTTVERIRSVVTAQSDTVWFGEVDFQRETVEVGAEIPPATLLLFGGPAPGGVAMADFPAIGLDAFCQKLLVYQDEDGAVQVIYNDIAALAELHYGTSAEPHHGLNKRLTQTFSSAVLE